MGVMHWLHRQWRSRPARFVGMPVAAMGAFAGLCLAAAPVTAGPGSAPPRIVAPSQITVVTGSIFRVGPSTYQISGIRTARIRRAQCFYEKRVGRTAQRALKRLLAHGPIEITPTGGAGLLGYPFVVVKARGQDVRPQMLARGYALPRGPLNDRRNPWCVQP